MNWGGVPAPCHEPRAEYGNRAATASGDDVVFRGPGGERVLRGHRDVVTGVAFSTDGRLLVSSSRDHHARLWDGVNGRPIRTLRGHFAVVSGASFSPDGRWVVTAGPGTAGLFKVRTGKLVFYLRGHEGKLLSARFDPSGRRIVTGGVDGTVKTYACEICGDLDDLLSLAHTRLEATR